MIRQTLIIVLTLFLLSHQDSIVAHPVIWKDGHAVMTSTDPKTTDIMYHYSLTASWSLGVEHTTFKESDTSYVFGLSNWLVKRWNERESQGNLYLLSGFGVGSDSQAENSVLFLGAQADWETRSIYTFFRAEYYGFDDALFRLNGRLGFAPYVGDFNDIHTWVIAQVTDEIIDGEHDVTVMPVVRLFKDNILVEFGSNFSGESMAAFMLHF